MTDAAWKPDPSGAHELRYWDGTDWTEHVADAGVQSTAPMPATTLPEPETAPPLPAWTPVTPAPPSGGWAAPAPATVVKPTANNQVAGWIVLGGALAAAVGSFLPWAEVSGFGLSETVSGFDGDGVITIVLAIIVGVLIFPLAARSLSRARVIGALVVAALVVLVSLIDIADVSGRVADEALPGIEVSVGIGLWLTLLGGIAALAGSILALVKRVEPTT